ncbi:MAG: 50S ribosomal protein L10 [Eubacteriaceae bacterium]|nr:50S ribosomal protein L10 [Eubacteriaceae bacterium]
MKGGTALANEQVLDAKKAVVSEIVDKIKKAQSFVMVDYQGLTVENATDLRAKAREMGVDYKVYKNTLMRLAAKETGYDDLVPIFEGITAVAFSDSDAVAPAKLIYDFVKDKRLNTLKFKGGVVENEIKDADTISQIAQLPSKDVLIARVLGSINAPLSKLVYVIDAIAKQKEEQAV